MADFQTISGEFAVRVNDGVSWVVYKIRAATEAEAHALAARLWGRREGWRVEHVTEPMPEGPMGHPAVIEEVEAPKAAAKPSAATSASSATSNDATGSGSSTTPAGGGRTTSA